MTDEQTMLAAYAAHFDSPTARLILADWFDDRDDPRGTWLRDAELAKLMGPTVENPVPKLLAKFQTKKASKLLVKIGRHAVPELLAAMEHRWGDERATLKAILDAIADADADLAEAIARLKSDDLQEQHRGLQAVGEFGERGATAIGPLLDLFVQGRKADHGAALRTIARLGSFADPVFVFIHRSHDNSWNGFARQLHDVFAVRGPTPTAIRLLVHDLSWSEVDESAEYQLQQFGSPVFEPVLEGGTDADWEVQPRYAGVLNRLPDGPERLIAAAKDAARPSRIRTFAIKAVCDDFHGDGLREDKNWLIPHLAELASDPNNDVAETALEALHAFGPRAEAVVPRLLRMLERLQREGTERLLALAIQVLAAIGPAAAVAVEAVRPLTKSKATSPSPMRRNDSFACSRSRMTWPRPSERACVRPKSPCARRLGGNSSNEWNCSPTCRNCWTPG